MAVANRYPAQPSGMGDDLFQIGCDYQARALAIDPGDARIERRRRKAARAVRNLFQLIKLWRSNQNIAGNPNINLSIAGVPRIRGRTCGLNRMRIFDPLNLRALTSFSQFLHFTIEKRMETGWFL